MSDVTRTKKVALAGQGLGKSDWFGDSVARQTGRQRQDSDTQRRTDNELLWHFQAAAKLPEDVQAGSDPGLPGHVDDIGHGGFAGCPTGCAQPGPRSLPTGLQGALR